MKKTNIGRGIPILLLAAIFSLSFIPSGKPETAKPVTNKIIHPAAITAYIDPNDMVQGGYYYYWDHGSGAQVAQFDRYDSNTGTIYNTYSITPLQSLFTTGGSISLYDAGNISLATLSQILHLLRCIVAGIFVP